MGFLTGAIRWDVYSIFWQGCSISMSRHGLVLPIFDSLSLSLDQTVHQVAVGRFTTYRIFFLYMIASYALYQLNMFYVFIRCVQILMESVASLEGFLLWLSLWIIITGMKHNKIPFCTEN